MKRALLHRLAAAAALAAAGAAGAQGAAAPPADEARGFSYFLGVGQHSVRHVERPSIVPARSRVRATSPLLTTGALYAITADTLLALDSEASFAPRSVTERWTATAGSIGGTVLTDPLLQRNGFSVQQNALRLLGQHRLQGPFFGSGGVAFHSHAFKRYAFVAGPDNAVNLPPGAVEETVSEVMLSAGAAFETERVRHSGAHYGLRATLAVPVWRRVLNTNFPDRRFSGTSGWDVVLNGRASWALRHDMHVGGWAQLVHGQRQRQVQGSVELPKSQTQTFSYGLELLWKL